MSLRQAYTLAAPFYDHVVDRATRAARQQSLSWLSTRPPAQVLLCGVGTGLDLPYLPSQHHYVGIDLTRAMLQRARDRRSSTQPAWIQGDALNLPFPDQRFDAIVLHLILAVLPDPSRGLAEATRVLRPGGSLLVFDKFLRPGQSAPVRRQLSRLTRHLATRLDVVFEDLLSAQPALQLDSDLAGPFGGWFRRLRLSRTD